MSFNRIGGFYIGGCLECTEPKTMSIDDQNKELNEVLENRLGQLNSAIAAHEQALKAMMIPRDVCHCYLAEADKDEDGQIAGTSSFYLGMIKWQGAWRLCHGVEYWPGPDDREWKPLVDSSIPNRLRAASHFDDLRLKIIEEKKKLIPEVEATIEGLAQSLERYEQPKPRNK